MQFESTYRPVAGTLPRLRYGRTYTFRARPVDLAGVSRTVKDAHPPEAESPSALFGRGPVPPPTIVRTANKDPLPGVGEFVTTIVLLSDYNTKLSSIRSQSRLLLPPTAAQFRLELSGLPHGGIKPSDYAYIAERDALSPDDECTTDPVSGDLVAKSAAPDVANPVEYFPDPAAAGAAFDGLSLVKRARVVPFVGAWPDRRGVVLVARATGSGPTTQETRTGNKLKVTVPKAFDGIVDVSCSIVASHLSRFSIVDLLSSGQFKSLEQKMLNGGHWMLSSRTPVRLVHAVRRPMTKPTIVELTADRPEVAALEVSFTGELAVHLDSTDRTTLSAAWDDPVDTLTASEPGVLPGARILGTVVGTEVALVPQFSDTKRHDLEVTAEAFSKFSSYFTTDKTIAFTTDTQTLDSRGIVGTSVVLSDPSTGDVFVLGADYTVNADAGSVTRVPSGAIPPAGTVTARYIRLPTSRLSTESSPNDTFALSVPASSPPTAARVREVIPAFSLTQSSGGGSITKTRSGQVLRLGLERPWYSSGPGELLGVLVDHSPGAVPSSTRYGRDPVVEGPGPIVPTAADFSKATSTRALAAPDLDVAGHAVTFDPSRGLWFSDVKIDGDLDYRPFVRLSVARYQPIAIEGAFVSSAVDLDPVRLGVVRTAKLKLTDTGHLVVTLTGVEHDGIPDDTNAGALLFNTVSVSLQTPVPDVTDPDLKWQTVQGPFNAARAVLPNGQTRWRLRRALTLSAPIRVLIQESEPSMRSDGSGGVQSASEVVYVETFVLNTL